MRSIIVVWTERNYAGLQEIDLDNYEVYETMEEAQEKYDQLLKKGNLVVASITGVIDSTDYEPYKTLTASERQLEEFLQGKEGVALMLRGQGDTSHFSRDEATNLCEVTINRSDSISYFFGGISEAFYDQMLEKYHWRYKEEPKEDEWDKAEVWERVGDLLIEKWGVIGVDQPDNHFKILDFIVEDIIETADPESWHSGDFDIAFRRWIEAQS